LLMQGGADHIVSVEACREFAAKAGAHCDFKLWDGCYHEIHNEPEKEAVFDFLLEWLIRNFGFGFLLRSQPIYYQSIERSFSEIYPEFA